MASSGLPHGVDETGRAAREGLVVGIDTGGTFTDIVVLHPDGEVTIDKSPTTPKDFSQGVIDAVAVAAESLGGGPRRVPKATPKFKPGTTAAATATTARH